MIDLVFWAPVMAGGALAGASSGVLGTFIVGMRIPFLGVCVAHAALAGAVYGGLCGLEGQQLLLPALAGAVLTALALGLLNPQRAHLDDNNHPQLSVLRHDGPGFPRHRSLRHPWQERQRRAQPAVGKP